ncbi:MAG: hypothetical protein J1E29_07370 [Duncaniella sp.]|nr:hypothetical protein [Duncaniella sp.]
MKLVNTLPVIAAALILAGCSKLSKEAKEIVGSYYNTELSQTEPVMELRADGTCLVRAIRPGVLSYSVEGHWNVKRDSLLMTLNPATLQTEGDSLLVGKIPERYASKIVGHTDFNLQLEQGGATYLYQRHAQ